MIYLLIIHFQLISDAIKYGPEHKPMMEMADYWMLEKQLVHKLFKVLVPRFQNYTGPVTSMYKAPNIYPPPKQRYYPRSVLEFKANPLPPINPNENNRNRNLIHNVLLNAARKDFYREKKEGAVSKENVPSNLE